MDLYVFSLGSTVDHTVDTIWPPDWGDSQGEAHMLFASPRKNPTAPGFIGGASSFEEMCKKGQFFVSTF